MGCHEQEPKARIDDILDEHKCQQDIHNPAPDAVVLPYEMPDLLPILPPIFFHIIPALAKEIKRF
jgi:hypothetical protein